MFLANSHIAFSQTQNVTFNLKDINSDEEISKAVVYISVMDVSSERYVYDGAISMNNSINLALGEGAYKTILEVDLPQTPGIDYYRIHSFVLNGAAGQNVQDVFLFPVASLRGIVKDKLDNIVGYADLRFECVNDMGVEFPQTTTKFGSIAVDAMPVGSCKIFASLGDAVGYEEINLNQGQLMDMEINLDKSIVAPEKDDSVIWTIILILAVLAALFAYIYFILKKEKKLEKDVKKEKRVEKKIEKLEQDIGGKRAEDIIPTLNAKEKDVMNHLFLNRKESSQARIRHDTGIPRTSLARVLQSLESKNIIKVEKHGKLVKVKLTPWFLGKD
ncbi:hypothetical protein COV19_04005 [Candidatus Woesearchaeota archaeon CG10_big_fil_rev_8_21_14_0_10_44_13]|nr:MAG: hypothetical protein COV19_04005 [Candidatus Woesearchaeota archaeon CG10_big_fil_rev_8_21_14_0_10_44_13]